MDWQCVSVWLGVWNELDAACDWCLTMEMVFDVYCVSNDACLLLMCVVVRDDDAVD